MDTTLHQLASVYGGVVRHDEDVPIRGVAPLDQAESKDLAPLLHPRYLDAARASCAGALLTNKALADKLDTQICWIHEAPRLLLAQLLTDTSPPLSPRTPGVHSSAIVEEGASLDRTARIEALVVIEASCSIGARTVVEPRAIIAGGAQVGEDCHIGPGAMVLNGSVVGDRVRIGPGAVIGSEGFGFLPPEVGNDTPQRIPQIGGVIVEDDVDIGALTVVDRATIGETVISRGAKLDNLIQVGHNAYVGEGVIIAAQTGLAGSVKVDAGALLGGQVGVADHLHIGQKAKVAAKSGVVSDVPRQATYAGYPAVPHSQWLRTWGTLLRRLTSRKRGI